jgi:SPP1 family predicted phage head-tail adaptor
MTAAGILEQRVRFERQVAGADDGYGNVLPGSWTELFTCWASFRPESGRERLEAGRLEATLRGVLRVRRGSDARGVAASDRVVFVAGRYVGLVCQIRATPIPSADGSFIEFELEEGVAI